MSSKARVIPAGYDIGPLIGGGYFGMVNGATHQGSGERVALKRLKAEYLCDEKAVHRFQREIRIMKKLNGHPNIVTILDGDPDELWFTMPRAEMNLGEWIARSPRLTASERLDVFEQVLAGVEHAQSMEVSHRDLAPSNVLVFPDRVLRVGDFGLGKDWASVSAATTASDRDLGHLFYTAPEQAAALSDASLITDIYSLGALLYFTFTGRIPYGRKMTPVSTVVEKAMNADPARRFGDISSFREAYEQVARIIRDPRPEGPTTTLERLREKPGLTGDDIAHMNEVLLRNDRRNGAWQDYVEPLVDNLSGDLLQKYAAGMDGHILPFAQNLSESIHELFGQYGWPFRRADDVVSLLGRVARLPIDEEARVAVVETLVCTAYDYDRYSAQDSVWEFLTPTFLSREAQMRVAASIINRDLRQADAMLRRATERERRVSPPILRAIQESARGE